MNLLGLDLNCGLWFCTPARQHCAGWIDEPRQADVSHADDIPQELSKGFYVQCLLGRHAEIGQHFASERFPHFKQQLPGSFCIALLVLCHNGYATWGDGKQYVEDC